LKVAIAYYSRTGNTEAVVRVLRNALEDCGAEVEEFRIKASREYSPRYTSIRGSSSIR